MASDLQKSQRQHVSYERYILYIVIVATTGSFMHNEGAAAIIYNNVAHTPF